MIIGGEVRRRGREEDGGALDREELGSPRALHNAKGMQGAAGGGGAHGRGAMGLGCVLELEQRAPLARTRARTREREGIWPGGIWIDPEEGGDLFERSGWAGGEIEEKEMVSVGGLDRI